MKRMKCLVALVIVAGSAQASCIASASNTYTYDQYVDPTCDPSAGWNWQSQIWWNWSAPIKEPLDGQAANVIGQNLRDNRTGTYDIGDPNEGWELYARRLTNLDGVPAGPQPANTEAVINNAYPGTYPYFVLYNKYHSKLRFYVYLGDQQPTPGAKELDFVVGVTSSDNLVGVNGVPSDDSYYKGSSVFQFVNGDSHVDNPPYKTLATIQSFGSVSLGGMQWATFEVPVAYDPSLVNKQMKFCVTPYVLTNSKITAKGQVVTEQSQAVSSTNIFTAVVDAGGKFSGARQKVGSAVGFLNQTSAILSGISSDSVSNQTLTHLGIPTTALVGKKTAAGQLASLVTSLAGVGGNLSPWIGAVAGGYSIISAFSSRSVPQYTKGIITLEGSLDASINYAPIFLGVAGTLPSQSYGTTIPVMQKTSPNRLLGAYSILRRPKAIVFVEVKYADTCVILDGSQKQVSTNCPTPSVYVPETRVNIYVESQNYWMQQNPDVQYALQLDNISISNQDQNFTFKDKNVERVGLSPFVVLDGKVTLTRTVSSGVGFSNPQIGVTLGQYWTYSPTFSLNSIKLISNKTVYWGQNAMYYSNFSDPVDADVVKTIYCMQNQYTDAQKAAIASKELKHPMFTLSPIMNLLLD